MGVFYARPGRVYGRLEQLAEERRLQVLCRRLLFQIKIIHFYSF